RGECACGCDIPRVATTASPPGDLSLSFQHSLFQHSIIPLFHYSIPMMKTALLFAGQGAQAVGMGKDLAENFPTAKSWFERANDTLGYDLASICFRGPEIELTKTENAQPSIFLVSWVAFQLLRERLPSLRFH